MDRVKTNRFSVLPITVVRYWIMISRRRISVSYPALRQCACADEPFIAPGQAGLCCQHTWPEHLGRDCGWAYNVLSSTQSVLVASCSQPLRVCWCLFCVRRHTSQAWKAFRKHYRYRDLLFYYLFWTCDVFSLLCSLAPDSRIWAMIFVWEEDCCSVLYCAVLCTTNVHRHTQTHT